MAQSATKNPAIRKRGGDPDVKEHKAPHGTPKSKEDKHGTPSPTKH